MLRQVNEILADHNVEKQMSDSRGEVAYMMADISGVGEEEIAGLYKSLETLGCRFHVLVFCWVFGAMLTGNSENHDEDALLI